MFVLHVETKIKPGFQHAFEKTFIETFRPAIARQAGFSAVSLLRLATENDYPLSMAFDDQSSKQNCVATDLFTGKYGRTWKLIAWRIPSGHTRQSSEACAARNVIRYQDLATLGT